MKGTSQPTLLVMRAGAIGDLVLTLPALAALRERFPEWRLVLAARADMLPLLQGSLADDVVAFDSLLLAPLFSGSAISDELTAKLGDLRAAMLWLPERTAQIVGKSLQRMGAAQIISADPLPTGRHAADHLLATLEPLGIPPQSAATPVLNLPDSVHDDAAWRRLGLVSGTRVVAVHVGSGGAVKRWPLEHFQELAARIAARKNTNVLLLRGPAEDEMEAIRAPTSPRIRIVNSPTIPALTTILLHCALYIGNDSGITHLAAALGRPTVALFGPTDPAIWGPRGAQVSIVCSPDANMRSLSVDRVWQDVCVRLSDLA